MRVGNAGLRAAAALCLACAPVGSVSEEAESPDPREGAIVGTVREAGSGEPLDRVTALADLSDAVTDAEGRYRLSDIEAGEVTVSFHRRDLVERTARVLVPSGGEVVADVELARLPPACCRLAGTWVVTLVLDRAGAASDAPATETRGTIAFRPDAPDPFLAALEAGLVQPMPDDDPTIDEFGAYDLDLHPLLGRGLGPADDSNPTNVAGYVYDGDRVTITLEPNSSHERVSLAGTIDGDEIRGTWRYWGGTRDPLVHSDPSGRFVMRRAPD